MTQLDATPRQGNTDSLLLAQWECGTQIVSGYSNNGIIVYEDGEDSEARWVVRWNGAGKQRGRKRDLFFKAGELLKCGGTTLGGSEKSHDLYCTRPLSLPYSSRVHVTHFYNQRSVVVPSQVASGKGQGGAVLGEWQQGM